MGNDYLEGNDTPARREYMVTELTVTGTIPAHLDGRYLRNGPNPITEVDPDTYHWFTSDGMVHGVRLRDGKAEWYRNRWVRTPAVGHALGEAANCAMPPPGLGWSCWAPIPTCSATPAARWQGGITNYELTDDLDTVGPCRLRRHPARR
jgi:carotenoid cleavage oxygenase